MSNKYVCICYICIFMCMSDIIYCSYIYNDNIVYSCKLYYVRIICGYDFSFYIFEEIS